MNNEQAGEVYRILDDLEALSVRLRCYGEQPPEKLVLHADKLLEACRTITDAVNAARRLLDQEGVVSANNALRSASPG